MGPNVAAESDVDLELRPILRSPSGLSAGEANDAGFFSKNSLIITIVRRVIDERFPHRSGHQKAEATYRRGSALNSNDVFRSALDAIFSPERIPCLSKHDGTAQRQLEQLYGALLRELQLYASSFTTHEFSSITQMLYQRVFDTEYAHPLAETRLAAYVPSREERYVRELEASWPWMARATTTTGQPVIRLDDVDPSLSESKRDEKLSPRARRRLKLKRFLYRYFPIFEWAQECTWKTLLRDFVAGTTVACTLIPQAMAYAQLANLDPIYGLYSAFVPQMIYAVLGTAKQAALGPVAVVSLLVGTAVSSVDYKNDKAAAVGLALLLSFGSGLLNLGMGLLRLGWITNFLSHPVLIGFMMGAGLNIGIGQTKDVFGISVPNDINNGSAFGNMIFQLAHLGETKWHSFVFGSVAFAILFTIKKVNRRFKLLIPGPLIVVVIATGIAFKLQLDSKKQLAVIGGLPSGMPSPSMPRFAGGSAMIGSIISIALIGYMETIAIGKQFARKNGYKVDPSQELIALGLSNFIGSFISAYPICVSFSRTAINATAGATSNVTKFVSAMWVALALQFLTPLVYWLPKPVLSAIIIMAVVELLDVQAAIHTWHFKKWDFLTLFACFVAVFFGGVELGVGVGILFSLFLVVLRMAFIPDIPRLGRLVGTECYEDKSVFKWAMEQPGLVVLQVRVPLYFFNREMLAQRVRAAEAESGHTLKVVVLDFGPCPDVDSDATTAIAELHAELHARGRLLLIVGLSERVKRYFDRSHLREAIGLQNFLPDVPTAVKHATYGSKDGTRVIGGPPAGAIGSNFVIQFMEETSRPSPGASPGPIVPPEFVEGGGI